MRAAIIAALFINIQIFRKMALKIFGGDANIANIVIAKNTATFASMGFTNLNVKAIFEIGEAGLKSWVPGRDINAITGTTAGKGYYIVAIQDIDVSVNFETDGGGSGGGGEATALVADGAELVGTAFTYDWAANPLGAALSDNTTNFNPVTDGTKTVFTGGALNLLNYVRTNQYFGSQNYTIRQKVKCKVKDANSHGIGFLIKSNRSTAPMVFGHFILGSTEGYISYTNAEAVPPTALVDDNQGDSNFIWAVDDEIILSLIRRGKKVFLKMENIGPSSGKGSVSELKVTTTGGGVGQLHIYFYGGSWEFQEPITVTYEDVKNPSILVIGDSITDGAGAINLSDEWFYRFGTGVQGGLVRMACGFERLEDGNLRVPDAALIGPTDAVIVALGLNNFLAGDTTGQLATKLNALIDLLQAALPGVPIVVPNLPPQGTDVTGHNTAMAAAVTAQGERNADIFTKLKNPSTTAMDTKFVNGTDPVHPGTLAQPVMAYVYKNAVSDLVSEALPVDINALPFSDRPLFLVARDINGKMVVIEAPNYIRDILYVDGFANYQRADIFLNGSTAFVTPAGGRSIITGNGNLANPNFKVEAGLITLSGISVSGGHFTSTGGQTTLASNWMNINNGAFLKSNTNLPIVLKGNITNAGTGTAALRVTTEGANAGSPAAGYRAATFEINDVEKAAFMKGGALLNGRYTTAERDALAGADLIEGLEIYNTTTKKKNFYNGTAWEVITSA